MSLKRKLNMISICYSSIRKYQTKNRISVFQPNDSSKFDFEAANDEIYKNLKEKSNSLVEVVGNKTVIPLPVLVTEEILNEFKNVQESICLFIKCVVSNYANDKRIQSVYNFSSKITDILDMYKDISFVNIGSYRYSIHSSTHKA